MPTSTPCAIGLLICPRSSSQTCRPSAGWWNEKGGQPTRMLDELPHRVIPPKPRADRGAQENTHELLGAREGRPSLPGTVHPRGSGSRGENRAVLGWL